MTAAAATDFVFPCRVYWEDTDGGGVVYYANYLKFMERARTEWLRKLGFEQTALREQYGILLVVPRVEADFKRPARLDDVLQVGCKMLQRGKASLSFAQDIYRDGERNELLLEGVTRVCCIDAATFKPKPMPDAIVAALDKLS